MFSASVIVAVFLGIGFLAARRISRPLAQITEGASLIAAGHYDHRLPQRSDDEIGRLSSTLNELARQTEERIEDLMSSRNLFTILYYLSWLPILRQSKTNGSFRFP